MLAGETVLVDTRALLVLGAISTGLVWGWLAGLLVGRVRRRILSPALVILATVPLALEIWWFLGLPALAWAGGAGVVSFCVHAVWRAQLSHHVEEGPL